MTLKWTGKKLERTKTTNLEEAKNLYKVRETIGLSWIKKGKGVKSRSCSAMMKDSYQKHESFIIDDIMYSHLTFMRNANGGEKIAKRKYFDWMGWKSFFAAEAQVGCLCFALINSVNFVDLKQVGARIQHVAFRYNIREQCVLHSYCGI